MIGEKPSGPSGHSSVATRRRYRGSATGVAASKLEPSVFTATAQIFRPAMKYNSLPSRRHCGCSPPTVVICHFPAAIPLPGKGCT